MAVTVYPTDVVEDDRKQDSYQSNLQGGKEMFLIQHRFGTDSRSVICFGQIHQEIIRFS